MNQRNQRWDFLNRNPKIPLCERIFVERKAYPTFIRNRAKGISKRERLCKHIWGFYPVSGISLSLDGSFSWQLWNTTPILRFCRKVVQDNKCQVAL